MVFRELFLNDLALLCREVDAVDEDIELVVGHRGIRHIVVEISVDRRADEVALVVSENVKELLIELLAHNVVALLVVDEGDLAILSAVELVGFEGDILHSRHKLIELGMLVSLAAEYLVKPPALQVLADISAKVALHHVLRVLDGIDLVRRAPGVVLHVRSYVVLDREESVIELIGVKGLSDSGKTAGLTVLISRGSRHKIDVSRL